MNEYLKTANSSILYFIVGVVLLYVAVMCVVFMIKSYKAGIKLGMDKKVLRKAITSSATFTILPSVSILLGVIALSGSLGIPTAWLRLSVVGNLQYESTVAAITVENMGLALDSSVLTMNNLVSIILIMTAGISSGCILSVFILKPYSKKLKFMNAKEPELLEDGTKRTGFANWAMVAMFIGLCATFVGSYFARFIVNKELLPMLTAIISAGIMAIFQFLIKKKNFSVLENFALAGSMLLSMVAAVLINLAI